MNITRINPKSISRTIIFFCCRFVIFFNYYLTCRYIEWERDRISEKSENLKYITEIFRRLVTIPTKLYNKHWDNFIAHVRDHHPRDILEYKDYDELRRITCKELGNFILLNICNNIIKSGEKDVKF